MSDHLITGEIATSSVEAQIEQVILHIGAMLQATGYPLDAVDNASSISLTRASFARWMRCGGGYGRGRGEVAVRDYRGMGRVIEGSEQALVVWP